MTKRENATIIDKLKGKVFLCRIVRLQKKKIGDKSRAVIIYIDRMVLSIEIQDDIF